MFVRVSLVCDLVWFYFWKTESCGLVCDLVWFYCWKTESCGLVCGSDFKKLKITKLIEYMLNIKKYMC